MKPEQITSILQDQFGAKITASLPADRHPRVHLDAPNWRAIAQFVYGDSRLKLDWLANLSGVDALFSGDPIGG